MDKIGMKSGGNGIGGWELARLALLAGSLLAAPGCASVRSFLALDYNDRPAIKPIKDPFAEYRAGAAPGEGSLVVRTRKGDRSLEVQLPRSAHESTDFAIPMGPSLDGIEGAGARGPASVAGAGTVAGAAAPAAAAGGEAEEAAAEPKDPTYLAGLARARALFRSGRFEASLVETEGLIRQYPVDPRLYRMRGTLLERVGRDDMAVNSWNQALALDPGNASLRKFVERRQQGRNLSSH